jgi:tetratricopeptide (TPR) repeat protein
MAMKEKAIAAEQEALGNKYLLLNVSGLYCDARMYADAERVWKFAIDGERIHDPLMYSNLSVFCGKQGNYDEAIQWADRALQMNPQCFHAKIVKASWFFASKRVAEAMLLYQECLGDDKAKSADPDTYWSCVACFTATSGDVIELNKAIAEVIHRGNAESLEFLRTDVVFDPYRSADWFIQLVGVTVVTQ